MISIKESFSDCSACKLFSCPSCILETNCEDDLTKVDVVFVAENPGKNEIEQQKPLIGKAGKIFRKQFEKSGLSSCNYLITNTVLCATINEDGSTGNPDDDTINLCKTNCFKMIDKCKPKLIVLMGTSPMKAFNIGDSGITKLRGNVYDWNGYKVFLTLHPSYVARNLTQNEPIFEKDFESIFSMVGENKKETIIKKEKIEECFRYSIPSKFYSSDYKLIDVQYLPEEAKILYIFRDKNNNKIFHKENDDYVCYQSSGKDRLLVPYEKLHQITIPYRKRYELSPNITYEGDVKLTFKHAQDYYHFNQGEPDVPQNVMFLDIEVFTGKDKDFPDPRFAKYPIVQITCYYNGWLETLTLNNDANEKITEPCKIFRTEKELLSHLLDILKDKQPDILTGWNVIGFDINYIFHRMKKIGMSTSDLSPFGYAECDYNFSTISGFVILDMLELYKSYTFTKLDNYKLNSVSMHELNRGKVDIESFAEVFAKDINKSIRYNKEDVQLLVDLDEKLKHIYLCEEIRKTCTTSYEAGMSPMGQIDCKLLSFLKDRGLASKNSDMTAERENFEGAYVKEPNIGVHDWIVDFDFTSLYPSIIRTLNIGMNTYMMKIMDEKEVYSMLYNPDYKAKTVKAVGDPMFEKKEFNVNMGKIKEDLKNNKITISPTGCVFSCHDKEKSFYSEFLEDMLNMRKHAKDKMKDAKREGNKTEEKIYDTQQLVMKVLSNTVYGIIGNPVFRFFERECARSITTMGQEAIKTSITHGDAYMNKFKTGKLIIPKQLSYSEVFGELDRLTPYVITGDTDSLFCCFENIVDANKPIKEIVNYISDSCKEIQSWLNSVVIASLVEKHGVLSEYNRLELKNELVIKRGLFLAKKRYAIHVINNEGVDVDKVNHMGLETKRSDFPRKTKDALNELIDMVLKKEKISVSELKKYVFSKEKEFSYLISCGDQSIARPCSYTKKLKEYKSIPWGVTGMETWNCLEYNEFSTGSKGYTFKIQGLDYDKAPKEVIKKWEENFKDKKPIWISIPKEVSRLPEYYIINKKDMLDFVWSERHRILLDSIFKVEDEVLTF